MKIKYYWKVCRVDNKKNYLSFITYNPYLELTYKIGKITKPKVGKIFLFGSRSAARKFKYISDDNENSYVILKVKCVGNVARGFYRTYSNPSKDECFSFWKYNAVLYPVCPDGTYYADAVLPVEKSH